MFGKILLPLSLALTGCAATHASRADEVQTGQQAFLDTCEAWDEWEKAAPPFKIYGHSYYVGSCGIATILITGEYGHILIDGGSRGGGPLVEKSIEQLGFQLEDVKILLHSHEHFDHVGGLAYLQNKSGAEVVSSEGARMALETGETQPSDPQHGMHSPFAPVEVVRTVSSYDPVSLGTVTLLPLETPGHTPGALSWQWWSCELTDCKMIVYADSLSPLGGDEYSFRDHPEYLGRYRAGLAALGELPCDILTTPHPSASWMLERMKGPSGLIRKGDCRKYADAIGTRLDKVLAIEAAKQ